LKLAALKRLSSDLNDRQRNARPLEALASGRSTTRWRRLGAEVRRETRRSTPWLLCRREALAGQYLPSLAQAVLPSLALGALPQPPQGPEVAAELWALS